MPYSARENDKEVQWFIQHRNISKVLDVGAGSGTYADVIGHLVDEMDAVEVWEPYVEHFGLIQKYDTIIQMDVREMQSFYFEHYDLVIFGDILEHMTSEEAQAVWRNASVAKWGLISVPIVHYPQGAEYGNPYEVHVQEHITPDELKRDFGPFNYQWEYNTTGTFIKEFDGKGKA